MLNTELVSKSAKDRVPTLNTNALIKAGILSRKPKNGERVDVKLVNSGGIVAEQDFYGSRDGSTMYAREGFNTYLFDLPRPGKSIKVGVCGAEFADDAPSAREFDTGRGSISRTTTTSRPTGLDALNRLIGQYDTKKEAAASIGVSTDTLRRMFTKAEAEAAQAKKTAKKATKSSAQPYGNVGLTKTELKTALKNGASNTLAGDLLGLSRDTIRRARKFFGL